MRKSGAPSPWDSADNRAHVARQRPTDTRIGVVGVDRQQVPIVSGGSFTGDEVQQWVYDVSGTSRVGFHIETRWECSPAIDEGGPIVVDRVYAR